MRVLTLSDEVVPLVYSLQIKERFADVALVFGCGDLPYYYLEYVTTMLSIPCLYVMGNHDHPEHLESGEVLTGPRGCIAVDDAVVRVNGLLVAGLGGSLRYNLDTGPQFSETQMMARCLRLATRIMWYNAHRRRGLDVMLSHAPLAGIHDGADRPHRGSKAFVTLQRWFRPRYWIHGHVHRSYSYGVATETYFNHTHILNTAGYRDMTINPTY
jgi:Icc-related predicted phosphoesterase